METVDEQGFRRDAAKVWDDNEQSRRRQLREDAGRSLAENLAEGLALSEFLSTFTGAARRSSLRAGEGHSSSWLLRT
ncbi:MAG TPA: hypothetical protein VJ204_12970 [Solirubrobacterales bacterium]|nr:hypothetical protein [Solirubrobacterales bacterium]